MVDVSKGKGENAPREREMVQLSSGRPPPSVCARRRLFYRGVSGGWQITQRRGDLIPSLKH